MKIELQLHLSDVERQNLLRPVRGVGGFQTLIKKLQKGLSGNVVTITSVDDIERITRYMKKYGKGGFQSRLKRVAG